MSVQLNTNPRFLDIPGSINFRDFGGYSTEDGNTVVWGKLFRCGALSMLSDEAVRQFGNLEISVICDLRRIDEAAQNPTPKQPPFDVVKHIPISQGSTEMLRGSIRDPAQTAADRVRFMTDINRELVRDHIREYQQLFQHLIEAESGFLLHCSAGKDRTGFGAALILSALGVREEDVRADYILTNEAQCLRHFMNTRMKQHYGADFDDDSLAAVGGVRYEYLDAALDEISLHFGSIENYLQELGVNAEVRQYLQQKFTTN